MSRYGQAGQVLPLTAVMSLGLLVVCGLVVDAGLVFAAWRDLQATADAAARAGAGVIDEDAYRSSGGRRAVLDQPAAEAAARARLRGVAVDGLQVSGDALYVRVSSSQPLLLLGVIGLGPVRIEARATARARTGVVAPGR